MEVTTTGQFSRDHLALLYRLSQTFNSSLDLNEVLNTVMDEIIAATRSQRGFVMLRDQAGGLAFKTARGMANETIDQPEFQISRSVVEAVAQSGKAVLTSNAQQDARFSGRTSIVALGLISILCAPLKVQDRVIGVVYVDNRIQAGIFRQDDLELLTAIATSAAGAIENARLYQIALEKARMERELDMARSVQKSLLPPEIPAFPGWEFAARWMAARDVAGDYYDFMPLPDNCLGLVVGDVTDKGLPASLFMVFSQSTIRNIVRLADPPAESISKSNRVICTESTQGLYITLIYVALDPETGEYSYVNGGHNPGVQYFADTDSLGLLMPTGMPLGIDKSVGYSQQEGVFNPGDALLLYTDGVTEAIDSETNEFGLERLQQVFLENAGRSPNEIMQAVTEAVDAFTGDVPPFDDTTIMVVKRL